MTTTTKKEEEAPVMVVESTEPVETALTTDQKPNEMVETNLNDENTQKEEEEEEEDDSKSDEKVASCWKKFWDRWCKFYAENEFVLLVIAAILIAKAYPPLGANYLQPEILSTWIAVIFIFRKFSVVAQIQMDGR